MSKPLKCPVSPEQIKRAQNIINRGEYYYTPEHAGAVKKILDTLHSTKLPVRTRPTGHSLSTMRIQYYQGLHYLLDHDPTGEYSKLAEHTICKMRKGEFLEFAIKENLISAALELATPWRDELTEYLDNATAGKKFYKPEISLTKDDIEWINAQLIGLTKPNGDPLFIAQVEVGMPLLLIRDAD